jgi:hypothetical protein
MAKRLLVLIILNLSENFSEKLVLEKGRVATFSFTTVCMGVDILNNVRPPIKYV